MGITKQHFEAKMSKFYKWLSDFNTRDKYPFDYNSSSKTFWCQPCEQAVPAVQKSQLKQHLESEKHRKNLGLKRSLVQSRLEFQDPKKQCISRQEQVNQDLCNAFLAANIPLNKLNYPVLKDCLEKNIGLAIAGVDTFRQKYVDVERSFSVYKNILTDHRHQLTEENLSKMIVCNCF